MKELKKRGITPTSLLEDTNSSDFELGGEMTGENRDFSRRSAVSTEVNKSLSNQRERSMQLNSEGLEVNFLMILLRSSEYAIQMSKFISSDLFHLLLLPCLTSSDQNNHNLMTS